jgi:hypothetical protein
MELELQVPSESGDSVLQRKKLSMFLADWASLAFSTRLLLNFRQFGIDSKTE